MRQIRPAHSRIRHFFSNLNGHTPRGPRGVKKSDFFTNKSVEFLAHKTKNRGFRFELFSVHLPLWYSAWVNESVDSYWKIGSRSQARASQPPSFPKIVTSAKLEKQPLKNQLTLDRHSCSCTLSMLLLQNWKLFQLRFCTKSIVNLCMY